MTKYRGYRLYDFVEDKFFRKSVLSPTEETNAFWENLLDSNSINRKEYTEAQNILRQIYPKQIPLDIGEEQSQALRKKIEKSTNVYQQRKTIRKYLLIASASAAIVTLSFLMLRQSSPEKLMEQMAEADIANIMDTISDVQLVLSTNTIRLEGEETNLNYTHKDSVSINNNTQIIKDESTLNQMIVPYGKRASLVLEDGSKIWVNAGSHIIYPSKFADNKRTIFIKGEIYAEVAKDSKRPFHIITSNLTVEVLGTILNISDYTTENTRAVVLVEGSVKVKEKTFINKSSILKPNEIFSSSDQNTEIKTVDISQYIAWKDGLCHFKNRPLGDVLNMIKRYYNVEIDCSEKTSSILCTGSIDLKENVDQVIKGISYAVSFDFTKKENQFTIY